MGRSNDVVSSAVGLSQAKPEREIIKVSDSILKAIASAAKKPFKPMLLQLMLYGLRLVIHRDAELLYWQRKTKKLFADLSDHFIQGRLNPFLEEKIRFLLSAQLKIVDRCIKRLSQRDQKITLADIGDSDGTLRLALKDDYPSEMLEDIGINLQPEAVQRLKDRGLNAIAADAENLPEGCGPFHIVTVLETLEHLPNPTLFLENAQNIVKDFLIISVPFVAKSRVALDYLDPQRWDHSQRKPTIENVHIFELCPADWRKLFQHCGWRIADEFVALQYPKALRIFLRGLWKYIDFEGFYCVALVKDHSKRSMYFLE